MNLYVWAKVLVHSKRTNITEGLYVLVRWTNFHFYIDIICQKNARVISTNVILGSLVGFINPFNKVMQFWEPTEANYMLGHFILGYNILWYDSYTLYVTSLTQATEFIFTDREQKCSILIIVKK